MIYMFFGDSHSRQFVGTSWGIFSHYVFSGATVRGLGNSAAVTGHAPIIRHAVSIPMPKTVFLMFGSVDLDLTLIRALCTEPSLDRERFLQERVDTYARFVGELLEAHPDIETVAVLGPQISPLRDEHFFRVTAQLLQCEEAVIRDAAGSTDIADASRVRHVLRFNDLLGEALQPMARARPLRIDIKMLGNSGLIRDDFVPESHSDHHARISSTQLLWAPMLKRLINHHVISG